MAARRRPISAAILMAGVFTACTTREYSLGSYPPWPDAALDALPPPTSIRTATGNSARDAGPPLPLDAGATLAQLDGASSDAAAGSSDAAGLQPGTTDGLLLWLRADQGVARSDEVLSTWTDTFTGRVATPPTAEASPSVINDALGQPLIAFNGDDELGLPELPELSAFTLLLVVEADEQPACPSFFHLSNRDTDLSTRDEIEVGRHMNTLYYETLRSPVSAPDGVFPVAERQLVTVIQQNEGLAELFMNHALVISAIVPAPPSVIRSQNFIGNNHWEREIDGECRPFIGRIAELMFYERAFSEAERAAAEEYLSGRWLLQQ